MERGLRHLFFTSSSSHFLSETNLEQYLFLRPKLNKSYNAMDFRAPPRTLLRVLTCTLPDSLAEDLDVNSLLEVIKKV